MDILTYTLAKGYTDAIAARDYALLANGGLTSYQNELNLKVTKYLNVWNQTTAQLASCYWTWVMRVDDKIQNPLGKYYMWYSTDHASSAAQYIGLAYSNDLTSGWTRYGDVFHHYSETESAYVGDETPSVIWDPNAHKFLMFSHANIGEAGEAQSTYRSESVDGITWTNTVKAFQNIDGTRLPGNLHNGYFMPFCLGGQWFGYSLMGGGSNGAALHWSEDGGYTWFTDHRQLGRWCLTGNDKWLYPNHSTVVTIRGVAYLLGVQSNFAAGTAAKIARVVLTPLADLRTPFGRSYVLFEPSAGNPMYEGENLRTLTTYAEDGKIYIYYNCKVGGNWYNNCAVIELSEAAAYAPPVGITMTGQPADASVTVGAITGALSVTAAASDGSALNYQWYKNTRAANTGGTFLTGQTGASMTIPTDLTAGTYYYYCVLSSATAGTERSSAATVTVTAASTAPVYLAKYTLTGTANDATPATIADESGHNQALTVNGQTAYNLGGNMELTKSGQSLYLPALTNLPSAYTLHIGFSRTAGGQHRLMVLPTNDIHFMFTAATASEWQTALQIESSSASCGFTSPIVKKWYIDNAMLTDMADASMDIAVSGDTLTISLAATYKGLERTMTTEVTITGFTAALAGGLYLGNRADGTRPLYGEVTEFWIREA